MSWALLIILELNGEGVSNSHYPSHKAHLEMSEDSGTAYSSLKNEHDDGCDRFLCDSKAFISDDDTHKKGLRRWILWLYALETVQLLIFGLALGLRRPERQWPRPAPDV